jgi:hypothetical protein
MKVISPFIIISSLSNTYPKKIHFEFSLSRKVRERLNRSVVQVGL